MKIYADTSFLVSLLYPGDRQHGAAIAFFRQWEGEDWQTTDWSQFETVNTLRQLCLGRPGAQPHAIESIRRLFKHWHRNGSFERHDVDLGGALSEGPTIKCRARQPTADAQRRRVARRHALRAEP